MCYSNICNSVAEVYLPKFVCSSANTFKVWWGSYFITTLTYGFVWDSKFPKAETFYKESVALTMADMSLAVSPVKLQNVPHFPRLPDNTDTT
jgi:hypothetical protein